MPPPTPQALHELSELRGAHVVTDYAQHSNARGCTRAHKADCTAIGGVGGSRDQSEGTCREPRVAAAAGRGASQRAR